jgi:hypothetical protein
MPLPMVHLAVAHKVAKNLSIADLPVYYLGSLSPDAVHIREGYNRAQKDISHLIGKNKERHIAVAANFIAVNKNDFCLGYGVHILTDYIWFDTVYPAFLVKHGEDKNANQDDTTAYYNDTDQLDFELFHRFEHRAEVWSCLEKSRAVGIEGLVSEDEVAAWKEHKLNWYDSGESKHKNLIKYFTYDEILKFINKAAREILDIIRLSC